MSELSMSEAFSLPMKVESRKDCCDEWESLAFDSVGDFAFGMPDDISVEHVVLAINSYDANQELIKKYESMLCKECLGVGMVGSGPDNYQDCPECVAPIQRLSDDNYRKEKLITKQAADIKLLRDEVAAMERWFRDDDYVASSARCLKVLAATNPDKE